MSDPNLELPRPAVTAGAPTGSLSMPIEITRCASQSGVFVATSPRWPGLRGEADSQEDAMKHLLAEVEGHRSLDEPTQAALRSIGGPNLVAAWDGLVRGSHVASWRCGASRVTGLLASFEAVGIRPLEACEWIGIGAPVEDAQLARESGMRPSDLRDFVQSYAEYADGLGYKERFGLAGYVAWIAARVPVNRALVYEYREVSPEVALQTWEPMVVSGEMSLGELGVRLGSLLPN